jgi:fatty-acyl-CoA synthase
MGALRTELPLWPGFSGPADLDEVERIPLSERGLPASTYELVTRAAGLWPDRPAVSVLADAERFHTPLVRSFAELAQDVHRAAAVLAGLGVTRREPIAVISVNCAELLPLLLASEAVGIYAPINPGLAPEHAIALLRLSGAKVIVASGPELDEGVWAHARTIAEATGARALLALRPTAASDQAPPLEPLDGVEVAYLQERIAGADASVLPGSPPAANEIASYLHTGGTTGTPKLAARTHANEVSNAWMMRASNVLDESSVIFAALPLFHTNALLVTVLAPLLRGQHVVWGGPLGYRDVPLFQNFPLTSVGKPYKPELRRRAAERAARDALAETTVGDQVRAFLVDGAVEIHVPHSAEDEAVEEVLSQYAWTWQLTNQGNPNEH